MLKNRKIKSSASYLIPCWPLGDGDAGNVCNCNESSNFTNKCGANKNLTNFAVLKSKWSNIVYGWSIPLCQNMRDASPTPCIYTYVSLSFIFGVAAQRFALSDGLPDQYSLLNIVQYKIENDLWWNMLTWWLCWIYTYVSLSFIFGVAAQRFALCDRLLDQYSIACWTLFSIKMENDLWWHVLT